LKDGGILEVELVIICSVVWFVCLVVDCSLRNAELIWRLDMGLTECYYVLSSRP
jgi:hypothetical protein